MERKVNYLMVGVFSVLLVAAAIAFVVWVGNKRGGQAQSRYLVYFEGAVNGLATGSAVRFLGVGIGTVEDITLVTEPDLRVRVQVSIESRVPVTTATIASLKPSGITGVSFIDLRGGKGGGLPLEEPPAGEEYPVIASEPSDLDKLVSGIPDIIKQTQQLLTRFEGLLSDENITAFGHSMHNIDRFTTALAENDESITSTMRDLATISASFAKTAQSLEQAAASDKLTETLNALNATSANLQSITERVNAITQAQQASVERFTGQGLTDLHALIQETRKATRDIAALAKRLEEKPSRLIYPDTPEGVTIAP